MSEEKRDPGRPIEIQGQTVVASYNVLETQRDWIKETAKSRGQTASDLIRELVQREMDSSDPLHGQMEYQGKS